MQLCFLREIKGALDRNLGLAYLKKKKEKKRESKEESMLPPLTEELVKFETQKVEMK